MEALIGFVATIAVIGYLTLMVWFVVIAVRFLRSGRKAFDRYVSLTDTVHHTLGPIRQGGDRPPAPFDVKF
jgi:hypothetical protein